MFRVFCRVEFRVFWRVEFRVFWRVEFRVRVLSLLSLGFRICILGFSWKILGLRVVIVAYYCDF